MNNRFDRTPSSVAKEILNFPLDLPQATSPDKFSGDEAFNFAGALRGVLETIQIDKETPKIDGSEEAKISRDKIFHESRFKELESALGKLSEGTLVLSAREKDAIGNSPELLKLMERDQRNLGGAFQDHAPDQFATEERAVITDALGDLNNIARQHALFAQNIGLHIVPRMEELARALGIQMTEATRGKAT